MAYVNCESAKEMARIRLFEEKMSLFKEVTIISKIVLKLFLLVL